MKITPGCVVVAFFLIFFDTAAAQSNVSGIQGRLFLQNNLVADAATINLIKLKDSSRVGSTTINKDGYFRFNNIAADNYVVKVSHIGYLTYVSAPINVAAGITELPDITLAASPAILKEVTIANKKAFIDNRSDRVILNVERGVMASGASVIDILNNAPGLKVNAGGEVFFKGNQRPSIAINGKVINLSPQDIAAQLQSMQSSGVGQIELIANPSAKYDAAGPGGLINIIMKKSAAEGFNGTFDAMAGYGNFAKARGGLNMNYRTGKVNIFGNYSFGSNHTDHTITAARDVGTNTNFNVNYYNQQQSYTNNYNGGIDYNIDPDHSIGAFVMGYYYNYFLDKDTRSAIANFGRLDSTLTTMSVLNRRISSMNYNLNYQSKLGNGGQTLTADADLNIYNRRNAENLNSRLLNNTTGTNGLPFYYENFAPTRIVTGSGRVDYINPISKKSRLEAGLKFITTKSDNSQLFENIAGTARIADQKLSSQFIYKENVSSAYVNFNSTSSGKFSYQLGLRAEHTRSDADLISQTYNIKRNYTDLFPTVTLTYNANAANRLSLIFVRRIDRPDYQSLNPLIAYQDKYNFTSGNAYLRPSYTDRIELKHILNDKLTTSVYAAFTRDAYNFTYFSQDDATGGFTSGKLNLKHVRNIGIDISLPVSITKKWDVDLSANGSYLHFVDYAGLLNKDAFDAVFRASNSITLPAGISLEISGEYEIPTFYYLYGYKSLYFVNAGLRKSLFNKLGTLSFTVDDAFNTNSDRYDSRYANLRLDGFDKRETRVFRLTFSYKFGKSTVKSRKHVSGNSDDLKRLTAGG